MNKTMTLLISAAAFSLAACQEQGPAEKAGEEIDEAIEDVRGGSEDMQNKVDDAVDELRDNAEDAMDEVEEGVEEAVDEVKSD